MIRLSAFADEISADLDEQIAVLLSENIHFIDLRGVWDTNVLDLTDQQVTEIKQRLDAQGIRVSAIASPIGKIAIDAPFDEHVQRFERAIELAKFFQTSFIRIFLSINQSQRTIQALLYALGTQKKGQVVEMRLLTRVYGGTKFSGDYVHSLYKLETPILFCSMKTKKISMAIPLLAA